MTRVPSCPDCGYPGKKVKGNHFRCAECGAVWEEVGWDTAIAREMAMLTESEKLRGINSLLAVDELICDNCGRVIKHAEKYCYDTNDIIDSSGDSIQPQRGKRYCVKCSLLAGYLRIVKDTKTGEEHAVMFRLAHEEYID